MQFNPCIPELSVSDLQNSLDFYVVTLGFKIEYRRIESNFVFLSFEGTQLMLSQHNEEWVTGKLEYPLGRGMNLQMFVSEVAPLVRALEAAGYHLMKAPWESRYRRDNQYVVQREFLVQDPDGYLLRFAQYLGDHLAK